MEAADIGEVLSLERATDFAPHWQASDYPTASGSGPLQRIVLVADIAGRIAGFAVVRLLTISGEVEAELESIAVAAELRRGGVGASLLAEALTHAMARGARKLDLEVRASNFAAIRFYERNGFRKIVLRHNYYRNPDEDAVRMRLIL